MGQVLGKCYDIVMTSGAINSRRQKGLRQIIIGVVVLLIAGAFYFLGGNQEPVVANFAECTAAGFPVMESYPRQCRTQEGQTFREDIGN